ncbi:MAG: hypothetical protein GKR89_05790 [Candidatus Latescibacteria bacterium]|nr:hypothetical protein [Candidatus Latescibacterota bacterium]
MEYEKLDQRKRLFVDRADIELQENIERVFHRAQKHCTHPVLQQAAPWEKNGGMTAAVIYDQEEGVFKAWYMAGHYAEGVGHVQCLATSKDGIRWERPNLGRHEALGSKDNNIVIPATYHEGQDHWETMLKDPLDADPARRYKAIGWSSRDWHGPLSGIYSATSPDGIDWSHSPAPIFRYHPRPGSDDLGPVGDAQSLMVDSQRRRYVAFLRGVPERLMSVSEDFVEWTRPAPFLAPLHEEEALYNNTGFNYGAHYLGILTHFNKHPLAQTQDLSLLCSRDGDHWQRAAGGPLVSLGAVGEWDRFQLMLSGAPPIAVGDKLYIYYRGTARRHAKIAREFDPRLSRDQDPGSMGIGLATLRLDGFASIGASFDGGCLTTRPLVLGGETLWVNAKADYGQLTVELLDAEDKPLPGYRAEDCVAVNQDSVAVAVRWGDGRGLGPLQGRPVKIRFGLCNARLYAYWCG